MRVNISCSFNQQLFSIPDFLDEEDIIHGDGGVIYIDNDIVTADYSVLDREESCIKGGDDSDNFDNVINHNNKLVNIIQNSLKMQAYIFDKLLNFVF